MHHPISSKSEPRLLRLPQVIERVGMIRAWIYSHMAADGSGFPLPIKLGRASLWDSQRIDQFIAAATAGQA